MFTGIIEDVGLVQKMSASNLSIKTKLRDLKIGDSISVNGTCLTVTELSNFAAERILSFDLSPETKQRTNLGDIRTGSKVNLERALRVGDRFGGHLMTGHIEDKVRLIRRERDGNSWIFGFSCTEHLKKYLVPKGSVGVDGISLTVVESDSQQFTVAVIPHTMENTNFGLRKPGERVNIEPDLLAKYVESILASGSDKTKLNKEFLRHYGFIREPS